MKKERIENKVKSLDNEPALMFESEPRSSSVANNAHAEVAKLLIVNVFQAVFAAVRVLCKERERRKTYKNQISTDQTSDYFKSSLIRNCNDLR